MMSVPAPKPEDIHPSLWRASQLARGRISAVETGYPGLSAELPGGGWPIGSLIEVLTQSNGCGEIRLLTPVLSKLSGPILLINPPADPSAHGFAYAGVSPDRLVLIRAKSTPDQLWSAEQTLQAGTCAAIMLWLKHARADSLRRLHLSARSGNALFFVMRHLSEARDASPAELRVSVRPAESGASVEILKRKGPRFEGALNLHLQPGPVLVSPYGRTRRAIAPNARDIQVTDDVHA